VTDLASAAAAAAVLARRIPSVVVTAGGDGVAGMRRGEAPVILSALSVTLVSTHGAGDAFVGALVAALAAGRPFAECLRSANAAAATHVSTRADDS
jgi:ribokinase